MRTDKEPALHGVVDTGSTAAARARHARRAAAARGSKKSDGVPADSRGLDQADSEGGFIFRPFATEPEARAALRSRAIKGYFVVPADYLERGVVDIYTLDTIEPHPRGIARRVCQADSPAPGAGRLDPPLSARVVDPLKETRPFTVSKTGDCPRPADGGRGTHRSAGDVHGAVPDVGTDDVRLSHAGDGHREGKQGR